MALRFFDGGGLYYSTLTDKWDYTVSVGSTPSVEAGTNGRWGGRCIMMSDTDPNVGTSGAAAVGVALTGGLAEYILQFAYNVSTASGGSFQLCSFYEGSTLHVDVRLNVTNNTITVTRNGTVLGTSSNNVWSTTAGWRYCKVKVKVHDTTGTITFVQDGVSIFTLTGLDTRNGGTGIIDRIYVGPGTAFVNGQMHVFRFNDISICDTTGSSMNDIHDEARARLLTVTANGDVNQWTASAGSNYQCVDEIPNNGNTDYVSTSTTGHEDLYACSDLPTTPDHVYGVYVGNMVAKDDAGTDSARAILKTGGTVYEGSSVVIAGATFQKVGHIWQDNPGTTAPWTPSEINALQVGVKKVA